MWTLMWETQPGFESTADANDSQNPRLVAQFGQNQQAHRHNNAVERRHVVSFFNNYNNNDINNNDENNTP